MKNILFVLSTLVLSTSAFAAPKISAFTSDNKLYVTLLGDCNAVGGELKVAPNCNADRMTADFTTVCKAELSIWWTEMMCPRLPLEPKVLVIDLREAKVTSEAEVLKLNVWGTELEVGINK
ncbi:MAG TPA: hypothetical protein VM432_06135 [Bdellovibrionales bacterium]|nr:hypothetical protein [Bdellovibrionales bacterium]